MATNAKKAAKDQNAPRLITVWALNALLFLWVFLDWKISIDSLQILILGPLAVAVTAVVNGMIGPETKARIVFWKWKNPSPEARVFSNLIKKDRRIDDNKLELEIRGAYKLSADEQTILWFEYYSSVQENPLVVSHERDYVYYRDYASMLASIVVPTPAIGFYLSERVDYALLYMSFLIVQYIMVVLVATRSGNEFATTVLAMSFAQEFNKRKGLAKRNEIPASTNSEEQGSTFLQSKGELSLEQKSVAVQRFLLGESLTSVAEEIGVKPSHLSELFSIVTHIVDNNLIQKEQGTIDQKD